MIKKKKGAIVNIGSGSTVVLPSYPLVTLYAATKAFAYHTGQEEDTQGMVTTLSSQHTSHIMESIIDNSEFRVQGDWKSVVWSL
ncbi:hypothetical protein JHK85_032946 [Glycine max]|nr:hypothetical protein JHK85_032946 [Glycine max]